MIYPISILVVMGVFFIFSLFWSIYLSQVNNIEKNFGLRLPGTLRSVLRTTLMFSFVFAGLSSMYLAYVVIVTITTGQ